VAKPQKLLVTIILLWLLGVLFLVDSWFPGIVLLIPGLGALGLCLREARRGGWGSVVAWAACSLAVLACLALFAVANVRLHEFTGSSPNCNAFLEDCSRQVDRGVAHLVPLVAFLVAGVLTLRLMRVARREERAAQPAEPDRKVS
jgi:hypothetical protein